MFYCHRYSSGRGQNSKLFLLRGFSCVVRFFCAVSLLWYHSPERLMTPLLHRLLPIKLKPHSSCCIDRRNMFIKCRKANESFIGACLCVDEGWGGERCVWFPIEVCWPNDCIFLASELHRSDPLHCLTIDSDLQHNSRQSTCTIYHPPASRHD